MKIGSGMKNNLKLERKTLQKEVEEIFPSLIGKKEALELLAQKMKIGLLTRDDDLGSHFCVMTMLYNERGEVLMGLHKKSGLILANGGHVDENELMTEAAIREINEEVGLIIEAVLEPELLTICPIENPKILCKRHYSFWFFIPVKNDFQPDEEKMLKEFDWWRWYKIEEAKKLDSSKEHFEALDFLLNKLDINADEK